MATQKHISNQFIAYYYKVGGKSYCYYYHKVGGKSYYHKVGGKSYVRNIVISLEMYLFKIVMTAATGRRVVHKVDGISTFYTGLHILTYLAFMGQVPSYVPPYGSGMYRIPDVIIFS